MDDIFIVNLPIEPMEERYSTQWWEWFEREFANAGIPHYTIPQNWPNQKIETGVFLDVIGTMKFKSLQQKAVIARIMDLKICFPNKKIIFFFHDIWNPAVLNIAYILDCMDLRDQFKICGCLHAGSYDPHDFLAKKNSGWMSYFENSLSRAVNKIFFATNFSRDLFRKFCFRSEYLFDDTKLVVTGFPIYDEFNYIEPNIEKQIVFPHRLDDEKQPWLFDELKRRLKYQLPDWKFIKTKEVCKTKKDYYHLLSSSSIAVSFALQETWGIAMQESLFCGCVPLVPNRLSYPEMYDPWFICKEGDNYAGEIDDMEEKISFIIDYEEEFEIRTKWEKNRNTLVEKGKQAIPNMIK